MWSPTHVQVTVYRAKNLLVKGKSGTNDAYVTIKLGDEKYQTSIKERTTDPAWMEECDLLLTDSQGVVLLNVYHRNLLGIDEFLGHTDIPLEHIPIYERPRNRWYALKKKPGSKKPEKYRGELEVKITYIVQSNTGSMLDINKKSSVKRSGSIKTLAHNVGEKLTRNWQNKGSLTPSGSRPDLTSDGGDHSPTIRKLDKHLARSHAILPTSFNNQHLQDPLEEDDFNEQSKKNEDFDRWQNVGVSHDTACEHDERTITSMAWYFGSPHEASIDDDLPLAPFRRKKKSRLSKMSILSHSTHTLDRSIPPETAEEYEDHPATRTSNLSKQKQMLAKSMFDLSSPTLEVSMDIVDSASKNTSFDRSGRQNFGENIVESSANISGIFAINEEPLSSKLIESRSFSNPTYQERPIDILLESDATIEMTIDEEEDEILLAVSTPQILIEKPPKPPRMNTPPKVTDESQHEKIGDKNEEFVIQPVLKNAVNLTPKVDNAAVPDNRSTKPPAPSEIERSMYISSSESDSTVSPELSPRDSNAHISSVTVQSTNVQEKTNESGYFDHKQQGYSEDRKKIDQYKRMKDVNRRHTMQYGRNNVPRATAYDLHENITEYKQKAQEYKERELPPDVIDQFKDRSREDLIRLIIEQNVELHKKEMYNRDMESYIDNLLVKVMEVTPKILQHPSTQSPVQSHNAWIENGFNTFNSSSVRAPSTPQTLQSTSRHITEIRSPQRNNNPVNVNNSNNRNNEGVDTKGKKKPFNPFKKLQQALK